MVWALRWWIIGCGLAGLVVAMVAVRYMVPVYESRSTILITRDKNAGSSAGTEMAMMQSLTGMGYSSNLQNEKAILMSQSLLESLVREKTLNVKYYVLGKRFQWVEQYPYDLFSFSLMPYEAGSLRYMKPVTIDYKWQDE
ncbi:MAG: hypothetical protein II963_05185, partial [Bacteroidales bacterium]|nr:hypothetical protein [Bacteroidales bacterium]